jgi:hypothetical protein
MKNIISSDISPMVLKTMNNTANNAMVRLAMPVSTSAIWGFAVFTGAESAIWGTSAIGGADRTQNFSAIWGTSPVLPPMQQPWVQ